MEKYLSNNTINKLNNIVNYIKESTEYKEYIKLRRIMSKDDNLKEQITKLKQKQKEYIKSNKDEKIKIELDKLKEELESNIIYFQYNNCIYKINEKIDLIKDELNNYFILLTNILK